MQSFKNILPLLLLAVLLGCDSPAERLFKEQIEITSEAADRMESGKWDVVYGQGISQRMLENLHKQQKLKIPAQERQQLEEKYSPQMKKARARLRDAWQKMTGKPASRMPGMPLGESGPEEAKPDDDKKPPSQ
jgi:hypothetical protein